MNRNFIFAFILLAALLMVNAIPHQLHKRDATCPANTPLFTATVSPDPLVSGSSSTFTLSGSLPSDVSIGSLVDIAFFDPLNTDIPIDYVSVDFCLTQGITCPIPAGTNFNSVVQDVSVPITLPESYLIGVAILDVKAQNIVGCVILEFD